MISAQIISFHCTVKNKLGHVLSSSFNQDVINQQELKSARLSGLVDGLQSVQAGEKRSFLVKAERAYGIYDPALIVELPLSDLEYAHQLRPGVEILRYLNPSQEPRIFRVVKLTEDTAILDGNHPLAGHDLIFDVEIVAARDAQKWDLFDDFSLNSPQLIH